jgi:hypothetical protein
MGTIQYLSGLVIFAMGIVVLIKLFKREGVIKGILGIICMLYTFIWGWIHVKEEDLKTIMWIWTALWILGVILSIATFASNIAS